MKCPICGKDLELQKKQIGTNENGDPIFNEYAICRDCRKQWNLDKQRAKKMAAKKAAHKAEAPASAAAAPSPVKPVQTAQADTTRKLGEKPAVEKPAAEKPAAGKKTAERRSADQSKTASKEAGQKSGQRTGAKPAQRRAEGASGEAPRRRPADGQAKRRPRPAENASGSNAEAAPAKKPVKRRAVQGAGSADAEDKRYSNIPPEKVRTKREKAARQGYEDMLATGTISKPSRKKSKAEEDTTAIRRPADKTAAKQPAPKPSTKKAEVDEYDDDDEYYDDEPRFRAMRIILGIISTLGFALLHLQRICDRAYKHSERNRNHFRHHIYRGSSLPACRCASVFHHGVKKHGIRIPPAHGILSGRRGIRIPSEG